MLGACDSDMFVTAGCLRTIVLSALMLTVASESTYDEVINAAHTKSSSLRRQLLTDWTLTNDSGVVTPTPGYFASFAAAPIQHVVAAMFLNLCGIPQQMKAGQREIANANLPITNIGAIHIT